MVNSLLRQRPIPAAVDRVIVHQFDASRPSPGGIDTCIRGLCRYAPTGTTIAVLGVDAGGGPSGRRLGDWELHDAGNGRNFWFMPVTRLDPGNQERRVPHALLLMMGVLRYRLRVPRSSWVQAHRADSAWVLARLFPRRRFAYFVHTQEGGLTGKNSDSFWRRLRSTHRRVERSVVAKADKVVVFNLDYADVVQEWNPATLGSPTWFDPALIGAQEEDREERQVIWVGRLEEPKDPVLAVEAFARLPSDQGWTLEMLGSGTRLSEVESALASMRPEVRNRVRIRGRVSPEAVANTMSRSSVFLMTSHPGYEGYPRVLVEAMASGLPAVVTHGSDTGGLVVDGITGFVTDRDPGSIATRIREAAALSRESVRKMVDQLSAPEVVARVLADPEKAK